MSQSDAGLVVLDIDGVVLQGHLIVALARRLGWRPYLRTLYDCIRFDKGLVSLEDLLGGAYGRLRGHAPERVRRVYRALRLRPGAERTVRVLKAHGWKVLLASSGVPEDLVADLVERLGADGGAGIGLHTENGRLTGRVSGALARSGGKRAYVERIVEAERRSWKRVVVVGDDRNNLDLMEKAGVSIGFRAVREVRARARFVVDEPNLDAILDLILHPRGKSAPPAEEQHPIPLGPWYPELRRKVLHGTAALVPLLLWFAPQAVAPVLIVAAALYAAAEGLRLNGVQVPVLTWFWRSVLRQREQRVLAAGPLTMALGVGWSLFFYPSRVACACIFILAFADSAACVVGERWGRLRLPYSHRKTLEGTLAGALIGICAASVFVEPFSALAGGAVAGFVESLNLRDWDNFWVPAAAGLAMQGVALL